MGRPRTRDRSAESGPAVPPELYHGIPPGAFRYFGPDKPSPDAGRHIEWTRAVREAGWTIASIREAAQHDQGYVNWLRAQRRERLIKQDPGGTSS